MVSDFGETVKTENSFGVAMERDLINIGAVYHYLFSVLLFI